MVGSYEPTEEESEWKLDAELEDLSKDLKDKAIIEEASEKKEGSDPASPDSS